MPIPSPAEFMSAAGIQAPPPTGPVRGAFGTVVPVGQGAPQGPPPGPNYDKRRYILAAVLCAGVGAVVGGIAVHQFTKKR